MAAGFYCHLLQGVVEAYGSHLVQVKVDAALGRRWLVEVAGVDGGEDGVRGAADAQLDAIRGREPYQLCDLVVASWVVVAVGCLFDHEGNLGPETSGLNAPEDTCVAPT